MLRSAHPFVALTAALCVLSAATLANASSTTYSGAGADAASIQSVVDTFRDALGALNAPEPVQNADGRRQINWDAAPAAVSAPNPFPGDFFNFSASPRARGIEFTTPGSGFQLSGDVDDGTPIRFENINPTYDEEFTTFSPERLFTPIDSNITYANFFSPADQTTPALTDGFGAVFTDVDIAGSTFIDYLDIDGNVLLSEDVPVADKGLSFVGVKFDDNVLAGVRIYSGNIAVGPNDGDVGTSNQITYDVVVMDDFIYGEPIGIPEPTTGCLAIGSVLLSLVRRRRV